MGVSNSSQCHRQRSGSPFQAVCVGMHQSPFSLLLAWVHPVLAVLLQDSLKSVSAAGWRYLSRLRSVITRSLLSPSTSTEGQSPGGEVPWDPGHFPNDGYLIWVVVRSSPGPLSIFQVFQVYKRHRCAMVSKNEAGHYTKNRYSIEEAHGEAVQSNLCLCFRANHAGANRYLRYQLWPSVWHRNGRYQRSTQTISALNQWW